jgi:hypothetical protein
VLDDPDQARCILAICVCQWCQQLVAQHLLTNLALEDHTSDCDTDALVENAEEGEECDAEGDVFYIDGCLDTEAHGRNEETEAGTSDDIQEDPRGGGDTWIHQCRRPQPRMVIAQPAQMAQR